MTLVGNHITPVTGYVQLADTNFEQPWDVCHIYCISDMVLFLSSS